MDDQQKCFDMIVSINEGNMQKVRDMIEEFGLSFCPLLDDGHQLLSAAVEKNQVEMVAYLLRKNAKVNSDRDVLSPLQIAAMNNNTIIFKMLLERGATVSDDNIRNHKSPIELAVEHNNIEIARLIVDHKNFELKCDQSLLHMAIKKNNLEMVSLLLETGADVDEYDDDGFAPIHHAVKACNDILQLLLDYGADINAKNKYGNTSFSMVLMHPFHIFYAKSNGPVGLSFPGNTQNNSKLDILLDNDADIKSLDIRKYLPHINNTNRIFINPKDNDGSSENKKRIIKQIVKLRSRNAFLSFDDNILLSAFLDLEPLDDFKKMCELEMLSTMTEKIPNSEISLHDILSKNSNFLAACARNKNHETFIFSSDISDRFPVYESVMKVRFSKGLKRKNLLEQSTEVFHDLFPVASKLLSDAVDDVFKCLDNKDLRHFLHVFKQDN